MRKRSLIIPTIALLGVSPLYARLGETPARIEARYGAPIKVENGKCSRDFKCSYAHGGFTITVQFLDDKSECEDYSKDGNPISEAQIQKLLEVNRRGGKWNRPENSNSTRTWRSDSGVTASYGADAQHPALEVVTRWWREYVTNRPKDATVEASESLKDF
jgi:hypothetical protein